MPDCLAAGIIDINENKIISILSVEENSKDHFIALPDITEDIFQGESITMAINAVGNDINVKKDYIKEIIIINNNLLYIFLRCKNIDNNNIVILVCENNSDIIKVLSKSYIERVKIEKTITTGSLRGGK